MQARCTQSTQSYNESPLSTLNSHKYSGREGGFIGQFVPCVFLSVKSFVRPKSGRVKVRDALIPCVSPILIPKHLVGYLSIPSTETKCFFNNCYGCKRVFE